MKRSVAMPGISDKEVNDIECLQVQREMPPSQQPLPPPGTVFGPGSRPEVASTGDVCLALDYLEDPAAHGVTSPEGVMEPAVFLCDIASLPGDLRGFAGREIDTM